MAFLLRFRFSRSFAVLMFIVAVAVTLNAQQKKSITMDIVPWLGGKAPYQVTLTRTDASGNAAEVLAEVGVASGNVAHLPMVDLKPGRYSIGVFHSNAAGEPRGWEEHNLYVVDASELPARP